MKPTVTLSYFLNRFCCAPLEVMFTLLSFIITKELGGTPLQVAVLVSAKPLVSWFAFYANFYPIFRPFKMRSYLVAIHLLGCLPIFFFSSVTNPWFFIFSYALFFASSRASFPAWSQILKSSIGAKKMGWVISKGTSVNYALNIGLPLLFGYWMDNNSEVWTVIFIVLALLSLSNVAVLLFIPINNTITSEISRERCDFLTPLRDVVRISRESIPFFRYLIVFFLGGFGIVMVQSILPSYFKEDLQLSYVEFSLAFSFCKGIAFLLASPCWAAYIKEASLFRLNGWTIVLTLIFFVSVIAARFSLWSLYFGYLLYGATQAGSDISWNISGPLFSKEENCISYSNANLFLVAFRGCLTPLCIQALFLPFGKTGVFAGAFIICLIGLIYAFWCDRFYSVEKKQPLVT